MAAPAVTSTLDRLRKAGVVIAHRHRDARPRRDLAGRQLRPGPTEFINVGLIGLTNGTIYGLVALGYTLIYGILQLINFAHGDVFALSGLVAWSLIVNRARSRQAYVRRRASSAACS